MADKNKKSAEPLQGAYGIGAGSKRPEIPESWESDILEVSTAALSDGRVTFAVSVGTTLLFYLATPLFLYLVQSSPGASESPDAEGGKLIHSYAVAAFTACGVVKLIGNFVASDSMTLRVGAVPLAISFMGSLCYALCALGKSPVYINEENFGCLTYPHRNLAWCFTTSLTIFTIWASSNNSKSSLALALILDWACMILGMTAGVTSGVTFLFWFWSSCLLMAASLYIQWGHLSNTIAECEGLPRAQRALGHLRILFVANHAAFGVAFYMCQTGTLPGVAGEAIVTFADVLYKCCLDSALGQGIVCTSSDRRQKRLQSISLDMVKQMRENDKHKDRFLAAMTHELRTPLNGIIGLTDSLLFSEGSSLSGKCRQALTTVRDTGRRFHKLINNILDNASLQEDKLHLAKQPVSLHQVMEECSLLIEPILSSDTKLVMKLPKELPLLDADYNRIMQVMFNLMGNAAKFTDHGTVSVTAEFVPVTSMVCIMVTDTGVGIPEDKQDLIFKPFEQVDMSKTRVHGGTGLGLTLALKLVQAHDGTLTVKSTPKGGTCFTVRLPVRKAPESGKSFTSSHAAEPEAPTHHAGSTLPSPDRAETAERSRKLSEWLSIRRNESGHLTAATPRRQLEILSVDDDPINQAVIVDLMSASQYKVTQAMNAMDALSLLTQRMEQGGTASFPDLILMDQMMPRMTGLEATQTIRSTFPQSCVPIIMVSANDDEDSICQGLEKGCNDYIMKPFKRMELLARVSLQLRSRDLHLQETETVKNTMLLEHTVPKSVLQRLASCPEKAIADHISEATVLFCEVVDFDELVAFHPAKSVVSMLSTLFSSFDSLVDKYKVHKVDTIGDTYVIVSGHEKNNGEEHVVRVVKAAKAMLAKAAEVQGPDGSPVRIRIGINTGPASGGIVGVQWPKYCIFGKTVSHAHLLEMQGWPMTIHLCNSSFERLHQSEMKDEVYFCDVGTRKLRSTDPPTQSWLLQEGEWEQALKLLSSAHTMDRSRGSFDMPRLTALAGNQNAAATSTLMLVPHQLERLQDQVGTLTELVEAQSAALASAQAAAVPSLDAGEASVTEEDAVTRLGQEILDKLNGIVENMAAARAASDPKTVAGKVDLVTELMGEMMGLLQHVCDCIGLQSLKGSPSTGSLAREEMTAGMMEMTQQVHEGLNSLSSLQQLQCDRTEQLGTGLQQVLRLVQQCDAKLTAGRPGSSAPQSQPAPHVFVAAQNPFAQPRAPSPAPSRGHISGIRPLSSSRQAYGVAPSFSPSQLGSPPSSLTGIQQQTGAASANDLVAVLARAQLPHYHDVLIMHGATIEALKALAPDELSQFGIHTPGAQDRLYQALWQEG